MSADVTASSERPDRRRRRRPTLPGLLRRHMAAHYCGMGVSTWDRNAAAGLTPKPIKIGGALCWGRHELAEWIRHGCPDRKTWTSIWSAIVARRSAK